MEGRTSRPATPSPEPAELTPFARIQIILELVDHVEEPSPDACIVIILRPARLPRSQPAAARNPGRPAAPRKPPASPSSGKAAG